MNSCTNTQSEDCNGGLQSGVVLEDTTFIMSVVVLAPCCWCLALYAGELRCRLSCTHLFASLISLLVMGRSANQEVLCCLHLLEDLNKAVREFTNLHKVSSYLASVVPILFYALCALTCCYTNICGSPRQNSNIVFRSHYHV